MGLKDDLRIKKAIISQLSEGELSVVLSMSKERKSTYACLVRSENNYLTFMLHISSSNLQKNADPIGQRFI
ncbi:hypothetical protein [Candidatus Enterococcus ferrettii]|uniref:hypothetical protein n=1 Tax=Candidatus Enterococcus ferrettii TaxID=2815324 RepID=UPI001A9B40D3|nr:hypothetical protein [Enterococcus sp. 665A]MBO1341280.1 hypothetical protein [Enterococcus sp. 665A]